jgi:hypothetical protein
MEEIEITVYKCKHCWFPCFLIAGGIIGEIEEKVCPFDKDNKAAWKEYKDR